MIQKNNHRTSNNPSSHIFILSHRFYLNCATLKITTRHATRRTFIKNSALTIAGATLLSKNIFAAAKPGEILGVQLYSVRDDMKKDPLGTLKLVAKAGYKNVEHANYVDRKFYGYSAVEFKKVLADLGLSMPSGHTVMGRKHWDESKNDFTDLWKYTVDDAATIGQKYVISPSLDNSYRKNYDDLKKYMEVFNKSGELCKKVRNEIRLP
ncbi:MAG: hypothetical protein WDO19_31440 [Bacteroidota bacterium]